MHDRMISKLTRRDLLKTSIASMAAVTVSGGSLLFSAFPVFAQKYSRELTQEQIDKYYSPYVTVNCQYGTGIIEGRIFGPGGWTNYFTIGEINEADAGSVKSFFKSFLKTKVGSVGEPLFIQLRLTGTGTGSEAGNTEPTTGAPFIWNISRIDVDRELMRITPVGEPQKLSTEFLWLINDGETLFTPTGTLSALRKDYPKTIPRFTDINEDNALELLKRDDSETFGPAAHTAEELKPLKRILAKTPKVGTASFSTLFRDPLKESRHLIDILNQFASSENVLEKNLANYLTKWVEYRTHTIDMFVRVKEYFDELEKGWSFEFEKLDEEFTRPLRAVTEAPTKNVSKIDDATFYLGTTLTFLTSVPSPLAVFAGGLGSIAMSLVDKYQKTETMPAPPLTTTVTGGKSSFATVIQNEFYALGVHFRFLVDQLQRTALRSYGMMLECATSEFRILAKMDSEDSVSNREILPDGFLPSAETGLREIMRQAWRKMIRNELILVGTKPTSSKAISEHYEDQGYLGRSDDNILVGDTVFYLDWNIKMSGPNVDNPTDGATEVTDALFNRMHWLFDTSEIIQMLIQDKRAYVPHQKEPLHNLYHLKEWTIVRRVATRSATGEVTIGAPMEWTTGTTVDSAPFVFGASPLKPVNFRIQD